MYSRARNTKATEMSYAIKLQGMLSEREGYDDLQKVSVSN